MMKKSTLIILFLYLIQSCKENNSEEIIINNIIIGIKEIFITQEISGNSVSRKVIIHAPEKQQNNKYPIMFFFHGSGNDAESGFVLSNLVNAEEFIGVYPQGYKKSWNLGEERSDADDVEFVNMIIEKLKEYRNLDTENIFAIGTSNGAAMVNELGLKTNFFKGIAPLSSQLLTRQNPSNTTNPMSVYQICGSDDETIPYEGGISDVGHTFKSAHDSAKNWAEAFNCNLNYSLNLVGQDSIFTYNNCKNNNTIKFKRIENGNHGLNGRLRERCTMLWEFFKKLI